MGLPGCILASILASSSLDDALCELPSVETIPQNKEVRLVRRPPLFKEDEYQLFRIIDEGIRWRSGNYELEFNYGRIGYKPDLGYGLGALENYRNTPFEIKRPKGPRLTFEWEF